LNRNKTKPFFSNLKKYSELNEFGKIKCILSFFSHIVIDAEKNIDNKNIQIELLTMLNEIILYKDDKFLDWLKTKLE
jgi:hypothetical protein